MLSWVPSIFKRFSGLKSPPRKQVARGATVPALLRVGNRIHPCTVLGDISDKTTITLRRDVVIDAFDTIDLKLDDDRTYRRVSVRWKQGLQLSVRPITAWAAPKAAGS